MTIELVAFTEISTMVSSGQATPDASLLEYRTPRQEQSSPILLILCPRQLCTVGCLTHVPTYVLDGLDGEGVEDKLVWRYDYKGNYYVRSGYRQALLLKEKEMNHASSSSNPTSSGIVEHNSVGSLLTCFGNRWRCDSAFAVELQAYDHHVFMLQTKV
ncbi:hypothetical protein Tco_1349658 [Tanacetum coccineum]